MLYLCWVSVALHMTVRCAGMHCSKCHVYYDPGAHMLRIQIVGFALTITSSALLWLVTFLFSFERTYCLYLFTAHAQEAASPSVTKDVWVVSRPNSYIWCTSQFAPTDATNQCMPTNPVNGCLLLVCIMGFAHLRVCTVEACQDVI